MLKYWSCLPKPHRRLPLSVPAQPRPSCLLNSSVRPPPTVGPSLVWRTSFSTMSKNWLSDVLGPHLPGSLSPPLCCTSHFICYIRDRCLSHLPGVIHILQNADPFFEHCRMMSRITKGRLRVVTDSRVYIFPQPGSPADKQNPAPTLKAEFRVLSPTFWIRLCIMGDLGFAEAYMYGDVECHDLPALFKVYDSACSGPFRVLSFFSSPCITMNPSAAASRPLSRVSSGFLPESPHLTDSLTRLPMLGATSALIMISATLCLKVCTESNQLLS